MQKGQIMTPKKKNKKPAQKKKQPAKMKRWSAGRIVLLFTALVVGFLLIFGLWGLAEAKIVHLQYTQLPLKDLPQALDGVTVLFISDFHMESERDARQTLDLMNRLAELRPDVLALGGDYSEIGLMDKLSAGGNAAQLEQMEGQRRIWRQIFFEGLREFPATLKIGVAGERDGAVQLLSEDMALGEIRLLTNEAVSLKRDGEKLWFIGMEEWSQGDQQYRALAEQMDSQDCVICVGHNPDALPALNNQKGKPWLDAMFSGHTHGGQITLFGGRALVNPSMYGERFLSGWHLENRTRLLVSNGLGTPLLPIRFFAPPQAHFITLKKA
jgi:predicted MPP superfamily phosphohydrolase